MSLSFDPTSDLAACADRLEPVMVTRPGALSAGQVVHALRRGVARREAQASEGRYTAADAAWHLPAADLDGPPRPGDVIVDAAGRRWTVLSTSESQVTCRYRCISRDLAIAHGLDAFVDVEEAQYAKGPDGADAVAWRPSRTGLRARIQPVARSVEETRERLMTRTSYRIHLADDLALGHRHRIRGPDGATYRIVAARRPERIDALLEIEATRDE